MKISVPTAIGLLHCLWWWAMDYAPDGDLTDYADWEIADAAFYEGKNPEKLKSALIFSGFLDNTEGRLLLHDWQDYGGKNLKRMKAANERNRRYRERLRGFKQEQDDPETQEVRADTDSMDIREMLECAHETEESASRARHETVTRPSQDADTRHDMTRHDMTGQDRDTPPLTPPQGGASQPDIQTRRFAEFWAAYPQKRGKGAAEKAWRKIHPDTELHKKIMESVTAHARADPQWQRDNGQYIPNPATWLNQKRWEDEKPKATQQMNGGGRDDGRQDDAGSGFRRSSGFRRADTEPIPDG